MLFAAICTDKPNATPLRLETRPRHLDYLKGLGDKVKVGGALLAPDNQTVTGSLLIFEAQSEAEVEGWLAQDPYMLAGVFASVEVKPWRQAVGTPLA